MLVKFMEILVNPGASQAGSSPARSFDLERPDVAPPLIGLTYLMDDHNVNESESS